MVMGFGNEGAILMTRNYAMKGERVNDAVAVVFRGD